jgi:hypothetical protein
MRGWIGLPLSRWRRRSSNRCERTANPTRRRVAPTPRMMSPPWTTMEAVSKPTLYGRARRPNFGRSRRFETTGLIVIVILVLAITISRYWHNVHWSTR